MESNIQFAAKENKDKWMLWLQIGEGKVFLTNKLKSKEEVENFIKRLAEKPINFIE